MGLAWMGKTNCFAELGFAYICRVPPALRPYWGLSLFCTDPENRILPSVTDRKKQKVKWKGNKHLSQTSAHLGVIWEMNWVSTIPASRMVGKVQGMEAGAAPTLADDQTDNPPHWLREPSPHLALVTAGARKSSFYLLNYHPTDSSIPIDPHSASASTIALHNKKGSWAWLHSPRLLCTFEMKNCFYYFKERCFDFCLLPSS